MILPRIGIRWTQRETALAPVGVAAVGDRARALARRLLRGDNAEQIEGLRSAGTEDALVFLGEASNLPWVDGVIYLGRDPKARFLLIPSNMVPSVPVDALERALAGRFTDVRPPIVVLPAHGRVFSAAGALPLAKAHLTRWLERAL